MKAANLPDEMKRNLLDQVRRQIGEANYDRAVSEVGEDRLLDLCLEQAAGQTRPARPRRRRVLAGLVWTLLAVIAGIILWVGGEGPRSFVALVIYLCIVLFPLVSLIKDICEWFNRLTRF